MTEVKKNKNKKDNGGYLLTEEELNSFVVGIGDDKETPVIKKSITDKDNIDLDNPNIYYESIFMVYKRKIRNLVASFNKFHKENKILVFIIFATITTLIVGYFGLLFIRHLLS